MNAILNLYCFFKDTNFVYMNPSATPSPSTEATGESEDAANNIGIGNFNINSSLEINKLSMPDSHNEDAANNFNFNMEDYTNLTDAWSRLPDTMGDLSYRAHYVF